MNIASKSNSIATGFTLVELVVILAVLWISSLLLAAIASVRAKAEAAKCISNERQIGIYTRVYLDDYNDFFPEFPLSNNWLGNLQITNSLLVCPTTFTPSDLATNLIHFGPMPTHGEYGLNAWGWPADNLGLMPNAYGAIKSTTIISPSCCIEATESPLIILSALSNGAEKPIYQKLFVPAMPSLIEETPGVGPGHQGTNIVLFIDSHVEKVSIVSLIADSPENRIRWDTDGQP